MKMRYHCIRNVSSPEDKTAGRTRYCGSAPADEFFEVPDDANVREFLEAEGVKKRTAVNDAMRDTLENDREIFGVLNGGITITCTKAVVDDKDRVLTLKAPSIINGSQTRGVLKKFFEDPDREGDTEYPSISFELIEDDDEEVHAKISVARNYQNKVAPLSVYGRMGVFKDLKDAMQKRDPNIALSESETDAGEGVIDTEKLIQVVTVTVPDGIKMPRPAVAGTHARPYAFSQKAVCLKDFDAIMKSNDYQEAKKYFLDVAYDVWTLYTSLDTNQKFKSYFNERKAKARASKTPVKKKDGKVFEVAQGLKFPIMSAMSLFVKQDGNGDWSFTVPDDFDFDDLVEQARITYATGPGNGDPARMGKTPDCYVSLYPVVNGYLKYRGRE